MINQTKTLHAQGGDLLVRVIWGILSFIGALIFLSAFERETDHILGAMLILILICTLSAGFITMQPTPGRGVKKSPLRNWAKPTAGGLTFLTLIGFLLLVPQVFMFQGVIVAVLGCYTGYLIGSSGAKLIFNSAYLADNKKEN